MPFEQPAPEPTPSTFASFESDCPWCGAEIEEGEPIYKYDGDWVCEYCHDAERDVNSDQTQLA